MADQDHYKVLGLTRNANADEIKQAFRKLAVQFHPDKHSHSSKSVRDNATLNFKRISQAYQILSDHRKRAHYDTISSNPFHRQPNSSCPRYGYGQSQKNYTYSTVHSFSLFDAALRYFTTRAFLLHCTFASVLVGGIYVIDMGREQLWRLNNSGKSFEAAMESVEKAKAQAHKDEM